MNQIPEGEEETVVSGVDTIIKENIALCDSYDS